MESSWEAPLPLCERCHLQEEGEPILTNQICEGFAISAHKSKAKLFLISAHQARRLIGNTKEYFFLFLREGRQ